MGNAKSLGRGLGSLLPGLDSAREGERIEQLECAQLHTGSHQPRKVFSEAALADLAESIRHHGIIQPLVVRKSVAGYELIAGERRLRAAKLLGLQTVPAVVRSFSDEQALAIALIENLQRENLNPIETANAYQVLLDRCGFTQDSLAEHIGKSRPHVTNCLRLLQLPVGVQEQVSEGVLSRGHARAILGVKGAEAQEKLATKASITGMSVRQLEALVQRVNQAPAREVAAAIATSPEPQRLQEAFLQKLLDAPVRIKAGKRRGKIEIAYRTPLELERILAMLSGVGSEKE